MTVRLLVIPLLLALVGLGGCDEPTDLEDLDPEATDAGGGPAGFDEELGYFLDLDYEYKPKDAKDLPETLEIPMYDLS